jgi:hypothetical protein
MAVALPMTNSNPALTSLGYLSNNSGIGYIYFSLENALGLAMILGEAILK